MAEKEEETKRLREKQLRQRKKMNELLQYIDEKRDSFFRNALDVTL